MAYDDALFQLGMDLARGSSTAQKEEYVHRADVAQHEDRKDNRTERDEARFSGKRLNIELFGARRLDDLEHIETTLRRCVEVSGVPLRHIHLYPYTSNGGVSGIVVLSQSHMNFYSLPESGKAALDVYVGAELHPHAFVDVLKSAFEAKDVAVTDSSHVHAEPSQPRKAAIHKRSGSRVRSAA